MYNMGNSPSDNVEEHERRESALREAADSTDQGVEHEEEAAFRFREFRCVVLCRLLILIQCVFQSASSSKQQHYSV